MTSLLFALRSIKQRVYALATPRPQPLPPQRVTVQVLTEAAAVELTRYFPQQDDPHYRLALAAQAQGRYTVYVARVDDTPSGFAYVMWGGHRNAQVRQRLPAAPEIYNVHVAARERSRGIGARLIQHIEQEMRTRGLSTACLGVHAHNRRAKALYARLGYRVDATPYFDEYDETDAHGQLQRHRIPAVCMHKQLR